MPALSASYDEQLAALPGVLSHRVLSPPADRGNDVFDALLVLETKAGSRKLLVRQLKSHVSREMATHVASSHKGPAAVLILAPHVGSGVAATLIERGLNYLDASGNCHISVPPFFVHVEGKSAEKARARPRESGGLVFRFYSLISRSLRCSTPRFAPSPKSLV
jgi:hypothetical protein